MVSRLSDIIIVFIYVGSICDTWILFKTESRCIDLMGAFMADFDGCKRHCEKHGAKRLTYFSSNNCECCTDSSIIDTSAGEGVNVYTCHQKGGNCKYFPK